MKSLLWFTGASASIVTGAAIAGADFDLGRWQSWVFLLLLVVGLVLAGLAGYFDKDKVKKE